MAEIPPERPWPLIELPLRYHKTRMHMSPYLAWVSSRVLDSIYQPTHDEVKRSLSFRLRWTTMPPFSSMDGSGVSANPQYTLAELSDRFWKIFTLNLCQRFAYLMGKISKYDNGVRGFLDHNALSDSNLGAVLFDFLQQALLMKFYQPGGIEPALEENMNELAEIRRQEHFESRRRQQALRERAARNAQRLEELRLELERALAGVLCRYISPIFASDLG